MFGVSMSASAALEALDNADLQQVDGQAGADLSLDLKLNYKPNSTLQYNLDDSLCSGTDAQFCRLGISLNNRKDSSGKKQWLVFKGIQGSINIQQLKLDGSNLAYKTLAGADINKAAINLGFNAERPIILRDVGFSALAIETDTVANEGLNNIPGYLAMGNGAAGTTGAYTAGRYTNTTNNFDRGRETGFMGLMIKGNLSVAGNIKMFSCDGTHPRC